MSHTQGTATDAEHVEIETGKSSIQLTGRRFSSAPPPGPVFPAFVAGALAFFISAIVLVIELLGPRLMAPYVGASLQVYTFAIGTVLTGISLGTWIGGRLADRFDPRTILGPAMIFGGIAVLLINQIITILAPHLHSRQQGAIALSFAALFLPVLALSSVNPALVKCQLAELTSTGTVVGKLSALSTAGAIIGTFSTGFVFVSTVPVTKIIVIAGTALIAVGFILNLYLGRKYFEKRSLNRTNVIGIVLLFGFSTILYQDEGNCDIYTSYYCVRLSSSSQSPKNITLWLDDLKHSSTDLADPTHLTFPYIKRIGAVLDSQRTPHEPVNSLFIGGGGFTLPKYLAASRPGSSNTILEVDPELVKLGQRKFGLVLQPDMQVKVGDARTTIRDQPNASYDYVVGDAFGREAVPWHLTTREFLLQVMRVMKPNGIYVMNIIDSNSAKFLRSEIRTIQSVFNNVVLMRDPNFSSGQVANFIVIASSSSIDVDLLRARTDQTGSSQLVQGTALDNFVGSVHVLRDDFAPVDQLLTS